MKFKTSLRIIPVINITIKQCVFVSNSYFSLEFYNAGTVTLMDKNSFINNLLSLKEQKALVKCSKTILIFKGYNEFSLILLTGYYT